MAARVFLLVALISVMYVTALAAPCIECKDCKGSNHCLSQCKRECPRQVVVNGEDCKRYGREAGAKVMKDACDVTLLYCQGGQKKMGARRFPVDLQQCGNIAYGLCQERAMNRWWFHPCGYAFNGYRNCNKDAWMSFFTGEVNDRCNQAVAVFDKKP